MELDVSDRHLRVHYSEKLVQLLREARQLAALGFPVAAKIQHTAATAWKFYHHAVVLKQVIASYACANWDYFLCSVSAWGGSSFIAAMLSP